MRVELVLVVGIVFLCCWCAFIVIKTHSSFSSTSAITSAPNATVASQQNYPPYHHQQATLNRPQTSSSAYRQAEANSPQLYYAARYSPPSTTPSWSRLQVPQIASGLPNQQHVYGQQPPQPYAGWPAAQPARVYARPAIEWQASASDAGEAQNDEEPEGDEAASGAGEADESGDQEADDENAPQTGASGTNEYPNSEYEEQVGRRSFREDQDDANERDRRGAIVKSRRRHLINGKPVEEGAPEEDRTGDFHRVVDEVDDDSKASSSSSNPNASSPTDEEDEPAPPDDRRVADESRLRGLVVSAASKRRAPVGRSADARQTADESPSQEDASQKGERDSHEHSLHESLRAQQWDDSQDPKHGGGEDEPADGMSSERAVQVHEAAKEPTPKRTMQSIGFEDLDRLVGKGKFPFVDANTEGRQRRKRRQASLTEPNVIAENQYSQPLDNSSESPPIFRSQVQHQLQGTHDTTPYQPKLDVHMAPDNGNPLHPQQDVGLVNSNMQLAVANATMEPPPLIDFYGSNPVNAIAVSPNLVELQGGRAALINLVPTNHSMMHSGTKKVKKKKKKSKIKFKKSQLASNKYKSAKAHALKKHSKYKKGGSKSKKKKDKKKLSKDHKEFKGATRGKKAAKGSGSKGTKKGALFYKDKGYKKRGFKKAYQKLETGDHKTYFDEFRDKDHNKNWKDFKDKHHYSQSKHWAGNQHKKYRDHHLKKSQAKKLAKDGWREKSVSKYKKAYKEKSKKKKKKKKATGKKKKIAKAKKGDDFYMS